MPKNYKEIHAQITQRYQLYYLNDPSSQALAEDIKDLTIDDVIYLLEEIKENPELIKLSISLSRRSDLFDKLILMKGSTPHEWVLRLHIYNMVVQSDEPGYVISNLNRKIRDDENHIHEHSWQLASRFLMGGFRNHQYVKTEDGLLFNRFNLVPTSKDGVSRGKFFRQAVLEGKTHIKEISDELYQQGDLVHYPIEIPHKVDTNLSPYTGITMTLAHTSERHHENSIFYEKPQDRETDHELEVEAQKYTEEEHRDAINMAITNLKLLKLCDQLAEEGFERFNRHVDPITKESLPNNVLETELLPTIAMLMLQKNNEFIEYPMTAEVQGKSQSKIQRLMIKYARTSDLLKKIINEAITEMDRFSLMQLIKVSQYNLLKNFYTASCNTLTEDALTVLEERKKRLPGHVISRTFSFFSHVQMTNSETEKVNHTQRSKQSSVCDDEVKAPFELVLS
ncbi:hypothetical protein [Legionella sainthelensi]|uniref:Uncharacterized protein n=1 Tax=Legionella sainthelensi TaxID=28087 RepID=A0A2H5FLA7_9GAMM|nr:hypothetical protein [Legionella sainthelensi]AUH72334.1 hypothetical protein CAB17_09840 [Legionella sainthelensi]